MLRTAHAHTEHPDSSHVKPDPARVAGISAAIVFNAALLLMLMRPIELPYQNASPEQTPTPPWTVVKPKPDVVVPVAKSHQNAQQHAQPIARLQPQVITHQQTPMSNDETIDPRQIELPQQPIGTVDPTPIEASLAYRDASPPPYPRDALRNDIEGTVQLRVLVDETGRVLDVRIERSSGDRQLDTAAREHVLRHWLFQPAQRNGVPMRAWGIVPIVFRLDNR
jgi:protein TonB